MHSKEIEGKFRFKKLSFIELPSVKFKGLSKKYLT